MNKDSLELSECSFCSCRSTNFIFFNPPYRSYPLCDWHTTFFKKDLEWGVKEMEKWEETRSVGGQDYPEVLRVLSRLAERDLTREKNPMIERLVYCLREINKRKALEFDIKSIAQKWNVVYEEINA